MTDWAKAQALKLAADLGRLHAEAEADRASLARVTRVGLALVRSLSPEAAATRLCQVSVELFAFPSAAVYVRKGSNFVRRAHFPPQAEFRTRGVELSAVEALDGGANEFSTSPWRYLVEGPVVSVLRLSGRHSVIGFLVAEGPLTGSRSQSDLFALLGGYAGVVLENFLFEQRREETLLARAPARPAASSQAALELGESAAMRAVANLVSTLARVDSTVLFTGETGTGKSLVARALHDASPRARKPFVTLNCGAIPEALVESELFGHEAGAFSGAQKRHRGRIEQAEGGTLFLDEIGELPLALQTKLLTFLEDRRYQRVGGEQEITANIRLLSATNADLEAGVREKTFRSDLLYRLNVFVIQLPPLRDREQDVAALARELAGDVSERYGLPAPTFDDDAERLLLSYSWPGNVRELRNVMEKAVILGSGVVSADLLPSAAEGEATASSPAAVPAEREVTASDLGLPFAEAKAKVMETWEANYVRALLLSTKGNVSKAARLASMDKKNLQRKIRLYEIDLERIRE